MTTDMGQLMASMENTLKLQNRARAQKRAEEAERDKKEFREKLRRAAVNKMELEELASKARGSDAAVQRDQLVSLMASVSGPF